MTLPTPLFESGLLTQDLADATRDRAHSINSEQSRFDASCSLKMYSKQDSKSSLDKSKEIDAQ